MATRRLKGKEGDKCLQRGKVRNKKRGGDYLKTANTAGKKGRDGSFQYLGGRRGGETKVCGLIRDIKKFNG